MKESIKTFMKLSEDGGTEEAQLIEFKLVPECLRLIKYAWPRQTSVSTHTTRDPPDKALVELDEKMKRRLLQGLQIQELCSECVHMEAADRRKAQRHHVRLLLKNSSQVGDEERRLVFDTMVSSLHMTHWQEICLDLRYARILSSPCPHFR